MSERLEEVLAAIDAANGQDPVSVQAGAGVGEAGKLTLDARLAKLLTEALTVPSGN